jgi:hypothetical protein
MAKAKREYKRKMFHVTVAFWTNGIHPKIQEWADKDGKKVAWDSGVIYIKSGAGHKRIAPMHFHKFSELIGVIDDAVEKSGVILIDSQD